MLNDCQGLATKLLLPKTALNGPVPCVPSPLAEACGVRISYIHFSNISWTPRVLDPITNPFLGPSSWLHPASKGLLLAGHKKVPHDFRLRTGDHSDTADYAGNLKRPAQRSMDD